MFYQERSRNLKSKTYNCALYIRLSRDDGDNMESESIKNQRDLIHMFLERTEAKLQDRLES